MSQSLFKTVAAVLKPVWWLIDEYIELRDAFECCLNSLQDENGEYPDSVPPSVRKYLDKMEKKSTELADEMARKKKNAMGL
jgi:hypothetical protein